MKKFKNCKKNISEMQDKIIDGKKYRLKVYHWKACKNCKEDCTGKINYNACKRIMGIARRIYK